MRIGFIKLGLKTYFKSSGSGEGSNHELVDVFHIFEERGHTCFMLSNNDIDNQWKSNIDHEEFDWIFVFNGLIPNKWDNTAFIMKTSLESLKLLRDHKDIPYAYFWTDPRYDISKNPIFKEIPPKVILSQEPKNYAHLDKLILYRKNKPLPFEKNIFFSILMNDTGETVRRKAVNDVINWLHQEKYKLRILGNWKKEGYEGIPEEEVIDYLSRVRYSFNCGKKKDWVSQKYWEMILAGVICFYTNYDSDNLLISPKDNRRVKDGIDVVDRIKMFENDDMIFAEQLYYQHVILKKEYFTGDFVYSKIMEKLK